MTVTRGELDAEILSAIESASDEQFPSVVSQLMFDVNLPRGKSLADQVFAYELLETFVDLLFLRDIAIRKLSEWWTRSRRAHSTTLLELREGLLIVCRGRNLAAVGSTEPPAGLFNALLRRVVMNAEANRRYVAQGRDVPVRLEKLQAFIPLDTDRFLRVFSQQLALIVTDKIPVQRVLARLHDAVDTAWNAVRPRTGKSRVDSAFVAELLYVHLVEGRGVNELARDPARSQYALQSGKEMISRFLIRAERSLGLNCATHSKTLAKSPTPKRAKKPVPRTKAQRAE